MTKPQTLLVKATHPERPCPKQRRHAQWDPATGRDRSMIYADTPVEVPNNRYYRRRIAKGDLATVVPVAPKKTGKED